MYINLRTFNSSIKLAVILMLFNFSVIYSQTKENSSLIRLIARPQANKILLRWAVNKPVSWKKTNKSGFILEKYIVTKLSYKKIWSKRIKAAPLNDWEEISNRDNFAAIIAQALYGDSFYVGTKDGPLSRVKNLSSEQEQRYSFGLFAADMSFEGAVMAGWGFVDTDVKKSEKYFYRIKAAPGIDKLNCKGSVLKTSLADYTPLPVPKGLRANFKDKQVVLTWDYKKFKSIYSSYNVERSENGIDFMNLTETPLVGVSNSKVIKVMTFMDTLKVNNKKYYYRVSGNSPFQEKSKYSKIVSGSGTKALMDTPLITDHKFTTKENNEVIIKWEYPKKSEKFTRKFQLIKALKATGKYKVVIDSIGTSNREVKVSNLNASNYFKINAIGHQFNDLKSSYSVLVQPLDVTPPNPPKGLKAEIDTLGVVRLSWDKNTEKDMKGYRVFRGFLKDEELSQITVSPIKYNFIQDTIQLKNLNKKIYYSIVAVDRRYNNSKKSDVLTVVKPDIIPPSSPVFKSYKVLEEGVLFEWINSPDAESYILLRKKYLKSSKWEIVEKMDKHTNTFVDKSTQRNTKYSYAIKAIDDSGLESLSTILTVSTSSSTKQRSKKLNYIINREKKYIELYWKKGDNVLEYIIYKKSDSQKPSTWKVLSPSITKVKDFDISPNESYKYYLKTILKDGTNLQVQFINVKF